MMGISNDYEAYMFDEVCRFYEMIAADGEDYNWMRIKWKDRPQEEIQQGNREMMAHIQSQM